jgi:hypothetical protein
MLNGKISPAVSPVDLEPALLRRKTTVDGNEKCRNVIEEAKDKQEDRISVELGSDEEDWEWV